MANPRTSPHATVQRHPHGDGDQKRFYTKIQVPLDRRKTNGKAKKNTGEGGSTKFSIVECNTYDDVSIGNICPSLSYVHLMSFLSQRTFPLCFTSAYWKTPGSVDVNGFSVIYQRVWERLAAIKGERVLQAQPAAGRNTVRVTWTTDSAYETVEINNATSHAYICIFFFVYLRATVCFISVEIGFRFDVENSILFVDQLQEGCRIGVSGSKSTELLYLGTLRYSGRGRRGVSIQWTIDVKENSPQLPEGKSCRPLSSPRFFGLYFTFSRGAKKQKSQILEKMVGMPAFMTSLHKLYVLSGCFTHHILLHQASRFHAISMSPFTTREGNQNNQHFHDDRWVNNEKYLRKKNEFQHNLAPWLDV